MSTRSATKRDIRERLEARRRSLLSRYDDALEQAYRERTAPAHERADVDAGQWDDRVLSLMTEVDLHTLDDVVRAIHRLDAGTYGTCTACDEPIEPARLAALPEAADCMECVQFAQETPPQWAVSVGDGGARRGTRAASEPAA